MAPEGAVPLSPEQARVLGVLVEKQATVPDTYPLSLNALVAGCNQKTARAPLLNLSESEVLQALDELRAKVLVIESSGGRVARYEHNLPRVWRLPGAAVALLAILMLRGPQTTAELRQNCERLHRFADLSSVEGFLEELATSASPWVTKLSRARGEREARWVQTLAPTVDLPDAGDAAQALDGSDSPSNASVQHHAAPVWQAQIDTLAQRVLALEAVLQKHGLS